MATPKKSAPKKVSLTTLAQKIRADQKRIQKILDDNGESYVVEASLKMGLYLRHKEKK